MLRAIDPLGAYAIWDWVRAGLAQIIGKCGEHYRSEDVYLRIRSGTAWLYVIEAGGEDIGFCVLTQEHDPDGLVMFIWCLWCEAGKLAPFKHELYDEVDALAKAIHAVRIRWWSPLKGWEREHWGKRVGVIFEREVTI